MQPSPLSKKSNNKSTKIDKSASKLSQYSTSKKHTTPRIEDNENNPNFGVSRRQINQMLSEKKKLPEINQMSQQINSTYEVRKSEKENSTRTSRENTSATEKGFGFSGTTSMNKTGNAKSRKIATFYDYC